MEILDIIESLLFEEESNSLDFKSEQYRFVKSDHDAKSELLKDILAFANSWRRTDAYILIGVKEVKGGKSRVIGIDNHIDDSQIQQFINSKTNKPIEFSYIASQFEGKQIAIIKIPVQKRPFYLQKKFNKLEKSVVYIRRGSSTDIALPDEIAQMGHEISSDNKKHAVLSSFFVSGKDKEIFQKSFDLTLFDVDIPLKEDFPSYGVKEESNYLDYQTSLYLTNHDYYYEYAKYIQEYHSFKSIRFGVKNEGATVARDVKLVAFFQDKDEDIELIRSNRLPDKPVRQEMRHPIPLNFHNQNKIKHDVEFKRMEQGWVITVKLGKIQAKDVAIAKDTLYIKLLSSKALKASVKIFSDDVEKPIEENLDLNITVGSKILTVSDFVNE